MGNKQEADWFESWFDSPFYHILYSNRDNNEARLFLGNLLNRLHLNKNAYILDLACGKGRHSKDLNERGYRVTGVDLSEKNIEYCKQFESDTLEFYVHDMRKIFRLNYFDAVFNLFTSFGYFEQDHQNELVVQAASKSLNRGGYFVLDFFNAYKAMNDLIPEQKISSSGIDFSIRKKVENGFILKDISFESEGKKYQFNEKVRIFTLEEIHQFLIRSGLSLLEYYGDYNLNQFDKEKSSRLILIARKL